MSPVVSPPSPAAPVTGLKRRRGRDDESSSPASQPLRTVNVNLQVAAAAAAAADGGKLDKSRNCSLTSSNLLNKYDKIHQKLITSY